MSRALRIYISAGEPSGDAHAAAVVTALKRRLPEASVEAFGGPGLEAAGAAVLDRMEDFSGRPTCACSDASASHSGPDATIS